MVVTGNAQSKERNITDFIDYIQYNNFEVADSKIYSVFDHLYKQYTKERMAYLQRHKKISELDSENLMYSLIEEIIADNKYSCLDFLIYNRISKKPVLAIEVNGYEYHKGDTVQASRDLVKNHILELYEIPLLRFKTNGSGEKEKIIEMLDTLAG